MSSRKIVFKYDPITKKYLKHTIETDFYRSLLAKEAAGQTFSHGDIRINVVDLMIRHRGEKRVYNKAVYRGIGVIFICLPIVG